MPHSQLKESIAHILKKAGYFSSVDKKGKRHTPDTRDWPRLYGRRAAHPWCLACVKAFAQTLPEIAGYKAVQTRLRQYRLFDAARHSDGL